MFKNGNLVISMSLGGDARVFILRTSSVSLHLSMTQNRYE